MQTPIKIGLIDSQEVVCKGLAALLNEDEEFKVVGIGQDMERARYICSKFAPHVLIIDFLDDGKHGIYLLSSLRQEFPNVKLFILTAQCDNQLIRQTLEIGVYGYWLKSASIKDLVNALRDVTENQPSFAPDVLRSIIHSIAAPPAPGYDLTHRELEVLNYMAQGFNNRKIAGELSISYSTVKNHVSKVLSKLDVSNRVEAVTSALENRLINI